MAWFSNNWFKNNWYTSNWFAGPSLIILLDAGGIASGEAFGIAVIGIDQELLDAAGIPSGENFGVAQLEHIDPESEDSIPGKFWTGVYANKRFVVWTSNRGTQIQPFFVEE